ncbi:thioester domain-containing protein [Saccharothrix lopnurensis]|uniref:Thioester domain-containing protein n=1 Tax=Saccharothrix lopnurensis TaxID=1670621 RepID=A0ABW1NZS1_9PSEU
MASRSTVKRLGAAILGAGLVLLPVLPAAAAEKPKVERFDEALDHEGERGMGIWLEDGSGKLLDGDKWKDGVQAHHAGLLGLKITTGDGAQTAKAYCVELPTSLDHGKELEEVDWDKHPNPGTKFKDNAGRINWILQNSYPALSVAEAGELYGIGGTKKSAVVVAAQAAIWHFSDGAVLREQDSTVEDENLPGGHVDEQVYRAYKYLIDNAQDLDEPKPTLGIDPVELSGQAGKKIGPFTVSTTATEFALTADLPAGVTLVDKDGKALQLAQANARSAAPQQRISEFWVQVDRDTAPGEVEFTASASAELRTGRLFVSAKRGQQVQSLVIASSEASNVTAKAKAKWTEAAVETTTTTPSQTSSTTPTSTTTAAPTTTTTAVVASGGDTDDLANTGASIFVPLLVGLGLLGAGAAALLVVRRKRTA